MLATARLAVVCAASIAALGCSSSADPKEPRAVVIGIDSADWTIIDAMIEAGDLPRFAQLKARGAYGELTTLRDIPLSPVVWTSIATGKVPAKHGVTWFLVDQPDGKRTPVQSTNRQTEAIWTIADGAGRRVQSIGWWATYPAETLRSGMIVSDAVGFHGFGRTARDGADAGKVSPEGLFPRFDALMPPLHHVDASFVQRFIDISVDDYEDERFDPSVSAIPNPLNPLHLFQQYAVTAQGYGAIADTLLAEDAYDLMLVYFEQVDSFSHLFMKYEPPRLAWTSDVGVARYSRVVREWYRYQDELLGRMLDRIDLETTAVFLVSDHGFKTGERRIRSEATVDIRRAHLDHETEGIFLAAGPGIARGRQIERASVLDITPTLLHYLDLPVGKDMDGRVLTAAFEGEPQERSVRYVTTYETQKRPRAGQPASSFGEEASEDVLNGLRVLGYMGAADEGSATETEGGDSSPEIHNNLARSLLGRGELDAATAEFEKALALDERSADALLGLATIQQMHGRVDLATRLIERALSSDPNSTAALSQLATLMRDRGDLKQAELMFVEALSINVGDPGLWVGFGDVLQRAGAFDRAAVAFQRAIELNPDDLAAHYNLGVTLESLGRTEDAVASYERALAIDPKSPQSSLILNNLGAIHRQAGQTAEALAKFEAAAVAFPGHLESRFNAAMIHTEAGRLDAALPLLEEAAAIEPNHELVHQQLGLTYLQVERTEDAFRALLLVRRRYPSNWRAAIGLAAIQAARGETEDARALWDSARAAGGAGVETFARQFPTLVELGFVK